MADKTWTEICSYIKFNPKYKRVVQQLCYALIKGEMLRLIKLDSKPALRGVHEKTVMYYFNHYPDLCMENFPFYIELKSKLQRCKNKSFKRSNVSNTYQFFRAVKQHYLNVLKNKQIRKHDMLVHCWNDKENYLNIKNEKRDSVIISSVRSLQILADCDYIAADGTFAIRPRLSKPASGKKQNHSQIFKIMGIKIFAQTKQHTLTIIDRPTGFLGVIAILEKKDELCYNWLYKTLRAWLKKYNLLKTKWNFEIPQRTAWKKHFHNIKNQGCTFHWNQAIMKNLGRFGLQCLYKLKMRTSKQLESIKQDKKKQSILDQLIQKPH